MADTSPARQIWAILAPLAALAGLAFLHYRRKGGGKYYSLWKVSKFFIGKNRQIGEIFFLVENEGKSVKKAVLAAESNIEEESISDENEELLHEGKSSKIISTKNIFCFRCWIRGSIEGSAKIT